MNSVTLTPGANTSIAGASSIKVILGWSPRSMPGLEVDGSAFMVSGTDKVPSDDYFVFYGAQSSPEGSVRFLSSASALSPSDLQAFQVDLAKVPTTIESLNICVTIHEGEARGQSFASLDSLYARVVDEPSGNEIARFDLQLLGMQETALILCQVYRRNGQWKLRAVGQGFRGGLAPLAQNYGVDIASDAAPPAPPKPTPEPAPAPKTVSLSKVTLEKRGQSVSLEKKSDRGFGEIIFNLNWNQRPPKKKGFLSGLLGGARDIDLDLGCLFELADGRKGVVQALGEAWGSYHTLPYIHLAGDDRSGSASSGENIHINGDQLSQISKILVYAFIYDGVPNWAAADGVATIKVPNQHDIEVRLNNPSSGQSMCAIALLSNEHGTLKVTKEERYFRGHAEMDKAYGWQLRWVAGSKD